MYSWFYWCNGNSPPNNYGISTMTNIGFGTSLPSGYTLADGGSASANNCFMWESYVYGTTPDSNFPPTAFTSYELSGCDSGWPGNPGAGAIWCPAPPPI